MFAIPWSAICCDNPWMILFQNCPIILSFIQDGQHDLRLVENMKIFFSRTTEYNETKLEQKDLGWTPSIFLRGLLHSNTVKQMMHLCLESDFNEGRHTVQTCIYSEFFFSYELGFFFFKIFTRLNINHIWITRWG